MRDRAAIPFPSQTFYSSFNPMPRPLSWLPRLHEISKTISNSVRSHYGRQDLERLFELQPRAAQKLLELLPVVTVGTSRLVEREVLAGFLERVREADDVAGLLDRIRKEKTGRSRGSIRTLVRRDLAPVSLASLPQSIMLSRGRLEVSFRSVEQLAEDLFKIAQLLTEHTDQFAVRFEPEPAPAVVEDAGEEVEGLFSELEQMERAYLKGNGSFESSRQSHS